MHEVEQAVKASRSDYQSIERATSKPRACRMTYERKFVDLTARSWYSCSMAGKLTPEQRDALRHQPAGEPLPLIDEETQRTYFLLDRDAARDFAVYMLRCELQGAIEQAERGELEPWDVEEIISESERQQARRKPSA